MTPRKATNAREQLAEYDRKRDFSRTAEPVGGDSRHGVFCYAFFKAVGEKAHGI